MPNERDSLLPSSRKDRENEERYYMGIDKRVLINTGETGLSTVEAARRLKQFGPNEIDSVDSSPMVQLFQQFWSPLPILLWIAILVEAFGGDWVDFCVLMVLQVVNGVIGWYEENQTINGIAALKASLKPEAKVIRDGVHQTMNAALLVPGDRVCLTSGGYVPADCELVDGMCTQFDQSKLTGESFPITMGPGDNAKMGSIVVRGEIQGIVTATGSETFYGKTASAIESSEEVSHFQKILFEIFLSQVIFSLCIVVLCLGYLLYNGDAIMDAISFCLVLLVISIPMTLQAICTATMALGSRKLAEEKVIVTNLQAIETLSSMNLLCSDKTGTLSRNKMELQDDLPIFTPGISREDVLVAAALASKWKEPPKDALDTLVLNSIDLRPLDQYELLDHRPFDPAVKRTESTLRTNNGNTFKTTKGAPQVILALAHNIEEIRDTIEAKVLDLARQGIRSLAVARTDRSADGGWVFLGLLTFLDPPRHDTKEMIELAHQNNIAVKMITGDQSAIAMETCQSLGMGTTILGTDVLPHGTLVDTLSRTMGMDYGSIVESSDGFAQVLPEHKYFVVDRLQQRKWIVGVTGDGVTDAPALKKADVGIAVEGSCDAAKAAANIVLAKPGLSVMIHAILLARRVFRCVKNYITYRISCTIHWSLFFLISIFFVHPVGCHFPYFVAKGEICPNQIGRTTEVVDSYFKLPVLALVLIGIVNDGTVLTIAYDTATSSKKPETWNLRHIFTLASTLGFIGVVSSIVLLYWGLDSWNPHGVLASCGLGNLAYGQVLTMMYLKISLSDFLALFCARTERSFFTFVPGKVVFLVGCFSTGLPTFLSLYWPFQDMIGISYKLVGFVWGFCLFWLFIQDAIKVTVQNLLEKLYSGNYLNWELNRKKYQRYEAHRHNRVRLGSSFVSSDSLMRDAYVAGHGTSGSHLINGGSISLDQAMDRLGRLETEVTALRQVIQAATSISNH